MEYATAQRVAEMAAVSADAGLGEKPVVGWFWRLHDKCAATITAMPVGRRNGLLRASA